MTLPLRKRGLLLFVDTRSATLLNPGFNDRMRRLAVTRDPNLRGSEKYFISAIINLQKAITRGHWIPDVPPDAKSFHFGRSLPWSEALQAMKRSWRFLIRRALQQYLPSSPLPNDYVFWQEIDRILETRAKRSNRQFQRMSPAALKFFNMLRQGRKSGFPATDWKYHDTITIMNAYPHPASRYSSHWSDFLKAQDISFNADLSGEHGVTQRKPFDVDKVVLNDRAKLYLRTGVLDEIWSGSRSMVVYIRFARSQITTYPFGQAEILPMGLLPFSMGGTISTLMAASLRLRSATIPLENTWTI